MSLTYWTTLEGQTYPGILTLNGIIDITDESLDYASGTEMRLGLEIGLADKKYNFREQILFFGQINDGNFMKAVVGKKNGRDLTNWDKWTRNIKSGDVVVKN